MHLKREKAPKNWTIPRKGSAYVVKPRRKTNESLPVLIALRDLLKVARNRKEVKKAIVEKKILVNQKIVKDDKHSLLLFDVLSINGLEKSYKLVIKENKKFDLEEINEKDSGQKISKVVGKKILKGKKTQLNLSDGRNVISDIKCRTDDSVLVDFKTRKVVKCLPLQEKASAIVFEGKHAGEKGAVKKINEERKTAELEINKKPVSVLIKQMIVVE